MLPFSRQQNGNVFVRTLSANRLAYTAGVEDFFAASALCRVPSANSSVWEKQKRGSSEIAFHFRECNLNSAAPKKYHLLDADFRCTGLLIAAPAARSFFA